MKAICVTDFIFNITVILDINVHVHVVCLNNYHSKKRNEDTAVIVEKIYPPRDTARVTQSIHIIKPGTCINAFLLQFSPEITTQTC